MTRRLTALPLLAALIVTSAVAPGVALATDPSDDVSVRSSSGRLLPPMPDEMRQPSVHAEMLADRRAGAFAFEPGEAATVAMQAPAARRSAAGGPGATAQDLGAAALPNGMHKEVFGFLPYWMLTDSALGEMNYSLVSTIAYFSVNVNGDGYLVKRSGGVRSTGWAGWKSSHMTGVINAAHARGVKVVLTVTRMAWDSASAAKQQRVLTSATRRTRLVNQIVDAVGSRGADGVNLDFEPVATSLRDEYVALVRELKAALRAADVGDYLTVCVMAGAATWATGYDVPALTASGAADALFVMGYDYHWSGSSRAGGVAPIHSPYTLDVDGTMLDFLSETSGSKLIWGVPYYGRTWRTTSKTVNGHTLSGGSRALLYTGHRREAARYGKRWDEVGKVPWYRYWDGADGNWVQGYYDDPRSLGKKYDLINARGLAGTGMWTLLMDQGRDELWRLLAEKFVDDNAPPVGGIRLLPDETDALSVKVRWRVTDHASGVDRYKVQVRPAGGTWQMWLDGTRQTYGWFSGKADVRYEFRVKAVDNRDNAQEWVSVPSRPTHVRPDAFARVSTPTLNVRSGPGTGYGVIGQAEDGDSVYVLEGPVSGSGYEWFRVQYGYAEWPSSEFARFGWMALRSDVEDYLKPAAAPTTTRLSPVIRDLAVTTPFSPNGDGRRDAARVAFRLEEPAGSVRLEIVNAAGGVVRSRDLGALDAGAHEATWDGMTTSGTVAPEGTYLPRIVANQGGTTHYGPAAGINADLLDEFGMRLDVTRPRVDGRDPQFGAELVAVTDRVIVDFSERMRHLGSDDVHLRAADGDLVAASNARKRQGRRVVITPAAPLRVDAELTVVVTNRPTDVAGNSVVARSWTFTTAPGQAYDPPRAAWLASGRHTAYMVGTGGRLHDTRSATFDSASSSGVGQRATLPNLPGRWLHVEDGPLGGRWLRESARAHLPGQSERTDYDSSTRIVMRKGDHTGYRLDLDGDVTARRRGLLESRSTPRVSGRRIVNGRAYFRVASGQWAGYLVAESGRRYLPGMIEHIAFPERPSVHFAAGTHTGYRYAADGDVLRRVTATEDRVSHAPARAWAVINGVPHFRITSGPWDGTWVPESGDIRVHG